MEKGVAVREWCLDRAIGTAPGYHHTDQIECAQAYEAYITGKEPKKRHCVCGVELTSVKIKE